MSSSFFTSMPSAMNARPIFVRLAIVAHAALFERSLDLAVVFVGGKIGDRLAKVPQELIAGLWRSRPPARAAPAAKDADRSRGVS